MVLHEGNDLVHLALLCVGLVLLTPGARLPVDIPNQFKSAVAAACHPHCFRGPLLLICFEANMSKDHKSTSIDSMVSIDSLSKPKIDSGLLSWRTSTITVKFSKPGLDMRTCRLENSIHHSNNMQHQRRATTYIATFLGMSPLHLH